MFRTSDLLRPISKTIRMLQSSAVVRAQAALFAEGPTSPSSAPAHTDGKAAPTARKGSSGRRCRRCRTSRQYRCRELAVDPEPRPVDSRGENPITGNTSRFCRTRSCSASDQIRTDKVLVGKYFETAADGCDRKQRDVGGAPIRITAMGNMRDRHRVDHSTTRRKMQSIPTAARDSCISDSTRRSCATNITNHMPEQSVSMPANAKRRMGIHQPCQGEYVTTRADQPASVQGQTSMCGRPECALM